MKIPSQIPYDCDQKKQVKRFLSLQQSVLYMSTISRKTTCALTDSVALKVSALTKIQAAVQPRSRGGMGVVSSARQTCACPTRTLSA